VNIPVSFPTLVVLVCTAIAAVTDWHNFTIRNFITLPLIASGMVYYAFFGADKGLADSIGAVWMIVAILFIPYVLGAMGAGDVKLFAAIGSVLGAQLVLPTFVVVVLIGGVLALISVVRSGVFATTMHRVLQILVGLLPGWQMPKFSVPADRRLTIPYGVAITIGAIIATAIFHA